MSEHYGICARCNKNLIIKKSDDYYFSEIDGEVLCQECWQKEQPKELSKQIADLQSQLAEKYKEIKYYESEWKGCQQKLDHYIGECINLQDEQNQKATEQLEKVRERLKHFCEIHSDEYYSVKSQVMGIYQDVCEFIDQQINELKGEKHYVHT